MGFSVFFGLIVLKSWYSVSISNMNTLSCVLRTRTLSNTTPLLTQPAKAVVWLKENGLLHKRRFFSEEIFLVSPSGR